MDALKASSEAARAAAGIPFPILPIIYLTVDAERASREAIQRKCEKLEEVVEVSSPPPNYTLLFTTNYQFKMLQMENANVTGLLTRKERIMKQEIESRQALETTLTTLTTEKSALQYEIQKIQQRLETVEASLATETALRAKADVEYAALRTQVTQASEKNRADLAALRAGIAILKRERKEDVRTMQLMAGELDRLKVAYAAEREEARGVKEQWGITRERQRVAFERALRGLRKDLEEQALGNQENVVTTGEALAELRALNGKIRAVDPDLR